MSQSLTPADLLVINQMESSTGGLVAAKYFLSSYAGFEYLGEMGESDGKVLHRFAKNNEVVVLKYGSTEVDTSCCKNCLFPPTESTIQTDYYIDSGTKRKFDNYLTQSGFRFSEGKLKDGTEFELWSRLDIFFMLQIEKEDVGYKVLAFGGYR